jgi:hypothetical protein
MRPIWDARIKLLPVATFFKSSVIDAPVSRVFGFHEREDALALLTRLGLLRARCCTAGDMGDILARRHG